MKARLTLRRPRVYRVADNLPGGQTLILELTPQEGVTVRLRGAREAWWLSWPRLASLARRHGKRVDRSGGWRFKLRCTGCRRVADKETEQRELETTAKRLGLEGRLRVEDTLWFCPACANAGPLAVPARPAAERPAAAPMDPRYMITEEDLRRPRRRPKTRTKGGA